MFDSARIARAVCFGAKVDMPVVYLPDVPLRIPGVKSSRYSRYQRTSDLR